jgi:hypothetical protein
LLTFLLENLTCETKPKINYKNFTVTMVKYKVKVLNPVLFDGEKFPRNPGQITSMPRALQVIRAWRSGETRWAWMSQAEIREAEAATAKMPARKKRSDAGVVRGRQAAPKKGKAARGKGLAKPEGLAKPKSQEVVESDEDDEEEWKGVGDSDDDNEEEEPVRVESDADDSDDGGPVAGFGMAMSPPPAAVAQNTAVKRKATTQEGPARKKGKSGVDKENTGRAQVEMPAATRRLPGRANRGARMGDAMRRLDRGSDVETTTVEG